MGQKHMELTHIQNGPDHTADSDWLAFPGGELEGRRPKALCHDCRARLKRAAAGDSAVVRPRTLCFQCYRAELDRERALLAAGSINTASEGRFQDALPFEPVNRPRLERLKIDRIDVRRVENRHAAARRHAQIAARRALHQVAAGLRARALTPADIRAAELQLPESWLPFVVSR